MARQFTREEVEQIKAELIEGKRLADSFWPIYLQASAEATTMQQVVDAWAVYQQSLNDAGVYATIYGYRKMAA